MTDRPIIFSAPMVRALLADKKTQTRRLATSPLRLCEVGDRLYVRESIYFWSAGHDCEITFAADGSVRQTGPNTGEIPDAALARYFKMADRSREKASRISRPSIHMPRWASRLTLIVEGVKIEPLQAISEADAIAEGAAKLVHDGEGHFFEHDDGTHVCGYAGLWDHLHGGGSWDANPEVVALTFRVVRGNIDQVPA
jgi:hypothetical protein